MNWNRLLNRERFFKSSITPRDKARSEFDADFDRITFSAGFRRLSRKTQVHPFSDNDHVHTRLTHSLEVARVGRTLGKTLGLALRKKRVAGINANTPEDMASIMAAACLGHDLGNPPFGHAGEDAILDWFKTAGRQHLAGLSAEHQQDLAMFEGNAQGLRMLTQTENHLFKGGLRLTYATLGAFIKYPWSSRTVPPSGGKFGAFLSEERILNTVAKKLGLVRVDEHRWCRHPLAFLSEAADDICYATVDIEDAVELGIIRFTEAKKILLRGLEPKIRRSVENELVGNRWFRINFARIRGPVFASLISGAIVAFMGNYDTIMNGSYQGDLFSLLPKNDRRRRLIEEGKAKGKKTIYPSRRKVELELGCYAIFNCVLEACCRAANERAAELNGEMGENPISAKSSLVLKLLGNHAPRLGNEPEPGERWTRYSCLRRMIDFASGQTDNYAYKLGAKIRGNIGP